jgi:hypothetical protein
LRTDAACSSFSFWKHISSAEEAAQFRIKLCEESTFESAEIRFRRLRIALSSASQYAFSRSAVCELYVLSVTKCRAREAEYSFVLVAGWLVQILGTKARGLDPADENEGRSEYNARQRFCGRSPCASESLPLPPWCWDS